MALGPVERAGDLLAGEHVEADTRQRPIGVGLFEAEAFGLLGGGGEGGVETVLVVAHAGDRLIDLEEGVTSGNHDVTTW